MPGGGRHAWPELDAPVLLAGDAEADLGALAEVLARRDQWGTPHSIASGIPAACAALRLSEFAVVVADVGTTDEALTILRAAGRGRPAARVICLLPPHYQIAPGLEAYIQGAAFAVLRHPLPGVDVRALVQMAGQDYARERAGVRSAHPHGPHSTSTHGTRTDGAGTDGDRWRHAQDHLAAALRLMVEESTGQPSAPETEVVIMRAVAAASRAARTGDDGPGLLEAVARALLPPQARGRDAA
ncbi:MAG: hypothetical protein M0R73_00405 [Dehalococcoidia bacterium]|nr:hypothetical protein [Dehalococcoidia bacterium]